MCIKIIIIIIYLLNTNLYAQYVLMMAVQSQFLDVRFNVNEMNTLQ